MARGDVKAGKSALIGSAGEYFVMGELLRRGWLAGMTPRGATDFDVLASKGQRAIRIRVKTKTADAKIFRWNRRKDGSVFRSPIYRGDFCVLVDLKTQDDQPEYYVTRTTEVEAKLQANLAAWLNGKAGRSPDIRMIAIDDSDQDWLPQHRSQWSILGDDSEAER